MASKSVRIGIDGVFEATDPSLAEAILGSVAIHCKMMEVTIPVNQDVKIFEFWYSDYVDKTMHQILESEEGKRIMMMVKGGTISVSFPNRTPVDEGARGNEQQTGDNGG